MEQHDSFYGWGISGLVFFGGVWFCLTRPIVKFLEQTPIKLTFRIRPTFFWGIGVFFGGIGLLSTIVALILTPITTLACSSSASPPLHTTRGQEEVASVNCELVGINWLGGEKRKRHITGLRKATVETKTETDSNGRNTLSYQVLLFTNEGDIAFNEFYNSDREVKQTLSSQINRFIESPLESSLIVQEDDRLLGYTGFGVGFFFVLLSFLVLAASPVVTCIFDKELNSMIIRRQQWFYEKIFEHPLNEILDIKVESAGDDDWMYRVNILLTSGEIPLSYSYTSGFEEKQQIAVCVRRFLV